MSETMLIPKADLQAACNAIREKDGSAELILSGQLADKIRNLPSGGGGELDALIDGSITTIRSNVEKVVMYAFANRDKLTTVELPQAKGFQKAAFSGCYNLVKLTAPNLQNVSREALSGTALTSVDLSQVTYLGELALADSQVNSVDAPQVSRLNESVCAYGYGLTSVNFPNATEAWESHSMAGVVTDYYRGTFKECSKLTDVSLPKLENLTGRMFEGCTSLQRLDFPALKSLAWRMSEGTPLPIFEGATALTALIIRTPTVCENPNTVALTGSTFAAGTGYIYVPRALVDQYKAANNWSTYANQIRAIEDYPEICGPTG